MLRIAEDARVAFHVIVPTVGEPVFADCTGRLLGSLCAQAQGYAREYVHVIVLDVAEKLIWCAETGRPIDSSRLATHLSRCIPGWLSPTTRAQIKSYVFGSTGPGA